MLKDHAPIVSILKEGHVKVDWWIDENFYDQIEEVNIFRSDDSQEGFIKLNNSPLSVTTTTFTDRNPNPLNFYRVEIIDQYGHSRRSISNMAQLVDEDPPSPPTGMQGVCDSNGIVTISWANNPEADLSGYYVFTANSRDAEFGMLTRDGELKEPTYQDSIELNTLADTVYYRIVAADYRGNRSVLSEPCPVKRPDINPPVTPVFKTRTPDFGQVTISFTASSSSDVISTELQRKEKNGTDWETVFTEYEIGATSTFVDTAVTHPNTYLYRLVAFEDDPLIATSESIELSPLQIRNKGVINFVKIDLEKLEKKQHVALAWEEFPQKNLREIKILRKENEAKSQTLKRWYYLNDELAGVFNFEDTSISKKSAYSYKIIVRYMDGSFYYSDFSSPIKIN